MKFIHTNIVSPDWQRLSKFYQDVFDCTPIGSRREYSGEWWESVVGDIDGCGVIGEHIKLPGYDDDEGGPTLEIFTYTPPGRQEPLKINDCGFAHICFEVPMGTLPELLKKIEAHGGSVLSTFKNPRSEWGMVYTKDPDGNVVEIHYPLPADYSSDTTKD